MTMVILGGMGNIWGVAAGAFIVYMIQSVVLKQLNSVSETSSTCRSISDINFLDYQFLLFGIALVLMMLFRPEGLFPSQRRRRELHIAEDLGDGAEAAATSSGSSVLEDAQDTTR